MTAQRLPLGTIALSAVVAGTTSWVALTAWAGFVDQPGRYLDRLIVVAVVVAAVGGGLRALGAPRWATALGEVLATVLLVTYQITGSVLPVGAGGSELVAALEAAVESAHTYAPPIGDRVPAVWPLLLVGGAIVILLVDLIACTLRRVPVAGLALLAVYSVPSGLLEDGPHWGVFVLAATGFMVLLHLDVRDQLLRWGPPVGPNDSAPWRSGSPVREAVRAGAGRIGIGATALALVVPAFIPVLGLEVFELGNRGGSGDIRIRKPIADMRRDLERGQDVPLIEIRTDDPDPSYLRVSVLNRFTGDEWSSGDREVDSDNTADGQLPAPVGLSADVPRREYDYEVDISDDFDSTWLPTQFPATAVRAEGDWRFDPTTLDFLAADDDLDTRGLSYTMTGLTLDYGTDGRYFGNASVKAVPDELLDLPSGLPAIVTRLARSVTSPGADNYERALLLQRWFRRDGGFTYNLERAPDGTGNQTLAGFLAPSGRVGYCEQYASAMAVMARVLGIPARVAVGFLEPDRVDDDTYVYSSHDLHAWPELYFDDTGWVRFEPTPSGRVSTVPDYTRVPVRGAGEEATSDGPSDTAQPSGGAATVAPSASNNRPDIDRDPGTARQSDDDGGGVRGLLITIGVVVLLSALLLVLLLTPRALRRRMRRTRLAGDPEHAWREVRASALDLGLGVPVGRSPREIGTYLERHLGDPEAGEAERPRTGADVAPEAAAALARLVVSIERQRYARPGAVTTLERPASTDAAIVVTALEAGVTPRARRRAAWWPRTVWRRD